MELMSQNYATLTPAYGRDYKNKAEVLKDFNDGKDFLLDCFGQPRTYINKAQIKPGITVNVRYAKKMKVTPIKVTA